jgi:hypothetical protein
VDDKEATLSAWGQDSGFLGGRFDVVIWDDLVDKRNTRTDESLNTLIDWYTTEAETRIDPGGLMVLQGQRIHSDDLYRYCLDKTNLDGSKKYAHIKYAAHDDDLCKQEHGTDAKPWPEGCLLDPFRLPWSYLEQVKESEPRTYNLMFQQRDDITYGGLVQPAWINGGQDDDGNLCPGSLDTDRASGAAIKTLIGTNSFISIDPSPTEFWGILWNVWDEHTQTINVLDAKRTRLTPEELLYLDLDTGQFSGLLHDWHLRALNLGHPLTHVIVEINAAQRWLLTQPHVQRWQSLTGVTLVPHSTNRNKNDPEYGVETLGAWFKHGRIRLPNGTPSSRLAMSPLLDELLRYPNAKTTDMVMSMWFAALFTHTHAPGTGNGRYERNSINGSARRGMALTRR